MLNNNMNNNVSVKSILRPNLEYAQYNSNTKINEAENNTTTVFNNSTSFNFGNKILLEHDKIDTGSQINKPVQKCVSILTEKIMSNANELQKKKEATTIKKQISHISDYDVKLLGVTIAEKSRYSKIPGLNGHYVNDNSVKYDPTEKQSYTIKNTKLSSNNKCANENKVDLNNVNLQDENIEENISKNSSDLIEHSDCVCCDTQTKELERNTFQLLYEHLKNKLKEFKMSTCTSSCIQPEEEQKLLYSILNKVKLFISENIQSKTRNVDEFSLGDNWDRTYGLLQEYLRTKIKKVQAYYNSQYACNANINENIQHETVTKVCELIENDFKRLKSLCTCKRDDIQSTNIDFEKNKDERNDKNNELSILNDDTSTWKKDMTSQSSNNNFCDTIDKQTVTVQTLLDNYNHNQLCSYKFNRINENFNIQIFQQNIAQTFSPYAFNNLDVTKKELHIKCHGHNMITDSLKNDSVRNGKDIIKEDINIKRNLCQKSGKQDNVKEVSPVPVIVPKYRKRDDLNVIPIKSKTSPAPYIGYTVDCSCDSNLGTCVCTKALIKNTCNELYDVHYNEQVYIKSFDKYILQDNKSRKNCINNKICSIVDDKLKTVNKVPKINSSTLTLSTLSNIDEDMLVLKDSSNIVFDKKSVLTGTKDMNPTSCDADMDKIKCELFLNKHGITKPDLCLIKYDKEYSSDDGCSNAIKNVDHNNKESKQIMNDVCEKINTLSSNNNCNCNKVPLCHIKMLLEDIEKSLFNKQCTCHSFCSKVCPIHSKQT